MQAINVETFVTHVSRLCELLESSSNVYMYAVGIIA
jgi:hypothetical protein